MTISKKKQPCPPEEETTQDIERQTRAFIKKLTELNRTQAGKEKKEKLKLDDKPK